MPSCFELDNQGRLDFQGIYGEVAVCDFVLLTDADYSVDYDAVAVLSQMLIDFDLQAFNTVLGGAFMMFAVGIAGGWIYSAIRAGK